MRVALLRLSKIFAGMLWVFIASGCTFDRAGITLDPVDSKPSVVPDASAGIDTQARFDGLKPQTDLVPKPDVAAPDSASPKPDVAPPKPDITVPKPDVRITPPPPSCSQIFGKVWNYRYCSESPTQCTFYVRSGGYSCYTICKSVGKTCLAGWNNKHNTYCGIEGGSSCGYGRQDQVCRCQR